MRKALLLPLLALLMIIGTQSAMGFGKNKVQYKNFEWYYIQSKHFDVYFYDGGQEIAEFTAEIAEEAYQQINRDWRYEIKERIVFIVYNSHNDWQQTNVVISYLEEGVGGVTELYKNRIVVPFEGSYEQFRHVIHHELVHAVMNDMIYGGSVQSLIVGEVTPVQLWFAEGLAEFQSEGWNPRLDMVVRDATLNGYMPSLVGLNYALPYQGGASVFRYIAHTYGRSKIGELLQKMRGKVQFERVLKSALGVGYEEFTERWHRYLRKQYWPEISDRKEPSEISKQLTFHRKIPNFLNVSPAISPNGDKIAFISDRNGYQNIYLMSAIDGKILKTLVKGNRSESFEELHFLRPGISFSPDGKKIVFSAKAGPKDAIYIVDIKSGDIETFKLDLDGAFTTSWSPDGSSIAFIGNKDERSDVFTLNLKSAEVMRHTNDVFTDDNPSWSSDGRYLTFVSDRKDYVSDADLPEDFNMAKFDYTRDVYTIELETGQITRITDTPWEENNPKYAPGDESIAYISESNGISNLFLHDLAADSASAVTNIISGILQIDWDRSANKMVYVSFSNGGYDIFLMNNPLELKAQELSNTQFVNEMRSEKLPVYARLWKPESDDSLSAENLGDAQVADYSNYVFNRYRAKKQEEKTEQVELAENTYQDTEGNYKIRKYKLKFSPDIVTGNAGYNTFFGFSGYTTFAFSDLLGDHKAFLNINLVSDLKNSDLSLLYLYLKRRISYGVGGYHLAWLFNSGGELVRYRNYGANFLAAYPFSRFKRMEFDVNWYNVSREEITSEREDQRVSTILPTASLVHDNVLWGYTGPADGTRYALSLTASPKYESNSREFTTLSLDYRKYMMLNRDYGFAMRFSGGASAGEDPQLFFLGGIDNWINFKSRGGLRTNDIGDVFFSRFVTPLRGAYFYEQIGTRYSLANMEFRFPLIQFLGLGFPPVRFFNIRGTMFYDIGTTWNRGDSWYTANSSWRGTEINEFGNRVFKNVSSGYGVGARVYFLYFLLRIDVAWNYNLNRSSKPIWYFSLGGDL
ncbi:MAG: peptidase MA family metallohydrolase [Calditrichia bacterium]